MNAITEHLIFKLLIMCKNEGKSFYEWFPELEWEYYSISEELCILCRDYDAHFNQITIDDIWRSSLERTCKEEVCLSFKQLFEVASKLGIVFIDVCHHWSNLIYEEQYWTSILYNASVYDDDLKSYMHYLANPISFEQCIRFREYYVKKTEGCELPEKMSEHFDNLYLRCCLLHYEGQSPFITMLDLFKENCTIDWRDSNQAILEELPLEILLTIMLQKPLSDVKSYTHCEDVILDKIQYLNTTFLDALINFTAKINRLSFFEKAKEIVLKMLDEMEAIEVLTHMLVNQDKSVDVFKTCNATQQRLIKTTMFCITQTNYKEHMLQLIEHNMKKRNGTCEYQIGFSYYTMNRWLAPFLRSQFIGLMDYTNIDHIHTLRDLCLIPNKVGSCSGCYMLFTRTFAKTDGKVNFLLSTMLTEKHKCKEWLAIV